MQYSFSKSNIANFMFALELLLTMAWGLAVEAASLLAAVHRFAQNGECN